MKLEIWHNLAWSRYKGGVFTALARLARERDAQVHVVQVALTDKSRAALAEVALDRFDYPHEVLFPASYEDIGRLRLYARVARKAWRSDADVTFVAGVDRPEYWVQAIVLALRGRKRAVFFDSTRFDRPSRPIRRLAKRIFFRLVPWSLSYGERARDYAVSLGVRPERALVRPQAAYLPPDYDAGEVPDLRCQHAKEAGPTFLFVGRLSPEKQVDVLICAFARYRAKVPQARLRIVGAGPDSAKLRTLSDRLRVEDAVTFAGPEQDEALRAEYLRATALVLPSQSEPWGLVVNEALHHGCPVIVTERCGCVPELVAGSPCGIVVPSGDSEALALAFEQAADAFADRATIARRCLETIAPFSPEAAARKILEAAAKL